jgi:hypothetical protein
MYYLPISYFCTFDPVIYDPYGAATAVLGLFFIGYYVPL